MDANGRRYCDPRAGEDVLFGFDLHAVILSESSHFMSIYTFANLPTGHAAPMKEQFTRSLPPGLLVKVASLKLLNRRTYHKRTL